MNRSIFTLITLFCSLISFVVEAKENPFDASLEPSTEILLEEKGPKEIKEQLEEDFRKKIKKGTKPKSRYQMSSRWISGKQQTFLLDTRAGIAYIVMATKSPEGIIYLVLATELQEPTREYFPSVILPIKNLGSLEVLEAEYRGPTKNKESEMSRIKLSKKTKKSKSPEAFLANRK